MKAKPFHKILIANRGEVARRIMRTTHEMNIPAACIFSDSDADALYIKEATESYTLGSGIIADTYLNIEKIINIAKKSGSDAIHPGYGFLSENFRFAEACKANSICFIGPGSETIRIMGDKTESHQMVKSLGISVIPKYTGSAAELYSQVNQFDFPVMVKAATGGGGKGMRIVFSMQELEEAIRLTSSEALNYFGDERVYIEKYLPEARHIEVQLLGDKFGNIIHLFERECSIQRRHQKIIEEAPIDGISDDLRQNLHYAALKIAKVVNYQNAGTVEFLLDEKDNYYFLEMNTRIQVEHPVTEMITDVDLVKEQILIAEGYPLSNTLKDVHPIGHAIEARVYAEDPMNDYLPSPGKICYYLEPKMENVRIESAAESGSMVSSDYDPLIAKVIAHGNTRKEAISKLKLALERFVIIGVHTNLQLLRLILHNKAFHDGNILTNFLNVESENINKQLISLKRTVSKIELLIAALIPGLFLHASAQNNPVWNAIGYWRLIPEIQLWVEGSAMDVEFYKTGVDSLRMIFKDKEYHANKISLENYKISFYLNNRNLRFYYIPEEDGLTEIVHAGFHYVIERRNRHISALHDINLESNDSRNGYILSPMHGRIIKISVTLNEKIQKGDTVMVVESMKLENKILSPKAAEVHKIHVKEGDQVWPGMLLAQLNNEV